MGTETKPISPAGLAAIFNFSEIIAIWKLFSCEAGISQFLVKMSSESIVSLNVGGAIFQTRPETMLKYENSKLAKMYEEGKKKKNLNFFLDQNPKYFEVVLEFLRNGEVVEFEDENFFNGVRELAKNLDLADLVDVLEKQDIYSMITLKIVWESGKHHVEARAWLYRGRNNHKFIRISRKHLTRVPESHLAKFFSGERGSQNPLSKVIFKENSNSNSYVINNYNHFQAQDCAVFDSILQSTNHFSLPCGNESNIQKELQFYGIIEGKHYTRGSYGTCQWNKEFCVWK